MRTNVDFRASVYLIQDMRFPMSAESKQPFELARAVRIALSKHRVAQTPAILGTSLKLIGIDAILAVREMADFPEELH